MASRSLNDLHPIVRAKAQAHLVVAQSAGIQLLVTCTYRSNEEQNQLYAKGRTAPGPRVTNARAGQSSHNFRLGYDVVPMVNGQPVWDTGGANGVLWRRVGELGKAQGLEWGGDWRSFKDMPHFQYLGGHPLSYFANGGTL